MNSSNFTANKSKQNNTKQLGKRKMMRNDKLREKGKSKYRQRSFFETTNIELYTGLLVSLLFPFLQLTQLKSPQNTSPKLQLHSLSAFKSMLSRELSARLSSLGSGTSHPKAISSFGKTTTIGMGPGLLEIVLFCLLSLFCRRCASICSCSNRARRREMCQRMRQLRTMIRRPRTPQNTPAKCK
jgi:hypothetical protein